MLSRVMRFRSSSDLSLFVYCDSAMRVTAATRNLAWSWPISYPGFDTICASEVQPKRRELPLVVSRRLTSNLAHRRSSDRRQWPDDHFSLSKKFVCLPRIVSPYHNKDASRSFSAIRDIFLHNSVHCTTAVKRNHRNHNPSKGALSCF